MKALFLQRYYRLICKLTAKVLIILLKPTIFIKKMPLTDIVTVFILFIQVHLPS